jgi:hypothetical protein
MLSWLTLLSALTVTSCGGGGSSTASVPAPPPPTPGPATAAAATAVNAALCQAVAPFYWEIGDVSGAQASGSVGGQYSSTDVLNIASASKWLFAAYVVEKKAGVLNASTDVPFLNFTSGYTNFSNAFCGNSDTVASCNASNGQDPTDIGRFHYNGGHMQQYAVNLGLGADNNAALATEVLSKISPSHDLTLSYGPPQPAGGVAMSAQDYAVFLRKLLVGSPNALRLGPLLGSSAKCTNPLASPGCDASSAAVVPEAWHYSLGHWVEDDPTAPGGASNFAYSSGGAFGFYPWVDTGRTTYGLIAREAASEPHEGYASGQCGRLIRLAWKTGVEQH